MDKATETFVKWGLDLAKAPAAVRASEEPIIRFFAYHDAHPLALSMALMEKFGHQWLIWESDTLKAEIVATFRATSVSEHNWNKIQAVRTILRSITFWTDWEVFEKVIQAFNNNVPRFDLMQRCSIAQLMAGVDIANQLREEIFGREIVYYTAGCAVEEGVMYLPSPLDYAAMALANPSYRCRDCGNVDTDDLSDGRCDFCCGRYQKMHNLDGKPAPWIPDEVGRNIDRFVQRNPEGVAKKFEEIRYLNSYAADPNSPIDVQASKLAVAAKYVETRQGQLVEQLKELKSWVTH
jgi:hypothetical protein